MSQDPLLDKIQIAHDWTTFHESIDKFRTETIGKLTSKERFDVRCQDMASLIFNEMDNLAVEYLMAKIKESNE